MHHMRALLVEARGSIRSPGTELQTVVSCHVGAEDQPPGLLEKQGVVFSTEPPFHTKKEVTLHTEHLITDD